MYRSRYRVFKDRLGWDVETAGDQQIDLFDAYCPAYLIQRGEMGCVQGGLRLLPTLGPTMLRDTFSILLDGGSAPASHDVWESSRFALDLPSDAPKASGGLAQATYELFAGMLEFGLSRDLSRFVTVTDLRMERILRRAGWPLRRLGGPSAIGTTTALAGYLDMSLEALTCIRRAGRLKGPVLWAPVVDVAA